MSEPGLTPVQRTQFHFPGSSLSPPDPRSGSRRRLDNTQEPIQGRGETQNKQFTLTTETTGLPGEVDSVRSWKEKGGSFPSELRTSSYKSVESDVLLLRRVEVSSLFSLSFSVVGGMV